MESEVLLDFIRIVTIIMSSVLMLVATASIGRKVADMEYQKDAGLNGVRWIQSWINLRLNVNRAVLGFAFLLVSTMSLMDMPIIVRQLVGTILFLVLLFMFTISGVIDWFAEKKQIKLIMNDDTVPRAAQLRIKGHSVNNKLALSVGIIDLLLTANAEQTGVPIATLRDAKASLDEACKEVKEIQDIARALDPNYKVTGNV